MTDVVSVKSMPGLVLESKEVCSYCGCAEPLQPHSMGYQKVMVLMDLARFLRRGDRWVRVETGRGMRGMPSMRWKKTEYRADFNTLIAHWFGLADKQKPRVCNYRINSSGLEFLRGNLMIPARILCRKGSVIFHSVEQTLMKKSKELVFDKEYWDEYPWNECHRMAQWKES